MNVAFLRRQFSSNRWRVRATLWTAALVAGGTVVFFAKLAQIRPEYYPTTEKQAQRLIEIGEQLDAIDEELALLLERPPVSSSSRPGPTSPPIS